VYNNAIPGALFFPRTTSRSFMTFAGEKKCMPTTSCGLIVVGAEIAIVVIVRSVAIAVIVLVAVAVGVLYGLLYGLVHLPIGAGSDFVYAEVGGVGGEHSAYNIMPYSGVGWCVVGNVM
jgi:hypothetical protein